MTEITPIRSRQEATTFENGDELLLKMTELPSTKEIEIAKFREETANLFRAQRQVMLENDNLDILKPTDPVELSSTSGLKVVQLRKGRIDSNTWWLEGAR